jgi:hypothetical protein
MSDDHDAQRSLEQRALRNVRALVDKLSQPEMRLMSALLWMVLIAAIILAIIYGAYLFNTNLLRKM